MRAVGVARTPVPQDQWPAHTVKIKGTPPRYSVALDRRPVNQFQVEPTLNFGNDNRRGLGGTWWRNRVRETAILERLLAGSFGGVREHEPVENSLDANSGELNSRAALRFRGEVKDGTNMASGQLLAAASEVRKDPPYEAARGAHRRRRGGSRLMRGHTVRLGQLRQR